MLIHLHRNERPFGQKQFYLFLNAQLMLEKDEATEIPAKQKMERQETLAREHSEEYKAALQRAVTLAVPHAYSPSPYGTFQEQDESEQSDKSSVDSSSGLSKRSKMRESWDQVIERHFDKDESSHMLLTKPDSFG